MILEFIFVIIFVFGICLPLIAESIKKPGGD